MTPETHSMNLLHAESSWNGTIINSSHHIRIRLTQHLGECTKHKLGRRMANASLYQRKKTFTWHLQLLLRICLV